MNVLEEMSASSTSDIWSNVILIKKTRELFSFSMWELLTLNVSGTWWHGGCLSSVDFLDDVFLLIISFSLVIKYSLLSLLCSAVQNCFYLISISLGRKWHTLIVFISNCSLICVKWQKLTIRFYIDISKTITLPDLPYWPQWEGRNRQSGDENILKRAESWESWDNIIVIIMQLWPGLRSSRQVMVVWHRLTSQQNITMPGFVWESEECQRIRMITIAATFLQRFYQHNTTWFWD